MSSNYPSSERPPYIEQLRAESRGLPYRPAKRKKPAGPCLPSPEDCHRLFNVEKGNRWLELARREPAAKMLFGELWHQGELCMLFADTNIGKSVLAVQIGESIARGQSTAPFTCQAPPARVLYIDFELTQAQFGQRYSNGSEDHEFSDNFFRAQYNFIPDPPPNVDENELLIAAIEYKIQRVKANVLIIDNITCLRGGTENSVVALSLMKNLKALKTDHKLSILVLAHTPKRRNPTQPISADDLHGSKLLINFADSAFAIGKSTLPFAELRAGSGPQCDTNSDLCYLKQIKQRNTRQRYGADNVCLCRIQKPGAFLHFGFEGYSAEHHHLLTRTAAYRRQMAKKIAELSVEGLGQRAISDLLGIPLTTVNRLSRCADGEGCADVQMCGCADEDKFEDLIPHARDEDEEGCVPHVRDADALMTNDVMTNDQNANKLMTNDVMTNDQNADEEEFEDLKISQFEDEEESANKLMTNDVMTNDQDADEEEFEDLIPHVRDEDEEVYVPQVGDANALMTNDVMTNDQKAAPRGSPNLARRLKTSEIDKLLTPELLDQILGTTTRQDFIRAKGSDCFNHPDTLMETPAKNGDP